jgi:hypothetical protein
MTPFEIRTILSSLKSNGNLAYQQVNVNLAANDLGSCLRVFSNEFANITSLNSLDMSDNSKICLL